MELEELLKETRPKGLEPQEFELEELQNGMSPEGLEEVTEEEMSEPESSNDKTILLRPAEVSTVRGQVHIACRKCGEWPQA